MKAFDIICDIFSSCCGALLIKAFSFTCPQELTTEGVEKTVVNFTHSQHNSSLILRGALDSMYPC